MNMSQRQQRVTVGGTDDYNWKIQAESLAVCESFFSRTGATHSLVLFVDTCIPVARISLPSTVELKGRLRAGAVWRSLYLHHVCYQKSQRVCGVQWLHRCAPRVRRSPNPNSDPEGCLVHDPFHVSGGSAAALPPSKFNPNPINEMKTKSSSKANLNLNPA